MNILPKALTIRRCQGRQCKTYLEGTLTYRLAWCRDWLIMCVGEAREFTFLHLDNHCSLPVRWHTPLVPALRRYRQEHDQSRDMEGQ